MEHLYKKSLEAEDSLSVQTERLKSHSGKSHVKCFVGASVCINTWSEQGKKKCLFIVLILEKAGEDIH